MAYLHSNICSKNYWNQTTNVKIIAGSWVVYFLRHSVQCHCCMYTNAEDMKIQKKITAKLACNIGWQCFGCLLHDAKCINTDDTQQVFHITVTLDDGQKKMHFVFHKIMNYCK